jgi:polysaccharide pyruvyl transferase CsaB
MALDAGSASFDDAMSAAPRFLVSGYYGFGNTGDEAILAGLIEGFRELRPAAELTVLSGNPAETIAEHGVIGVPRGLASARRQLGLSDALISGGGGLLQDVTSWRSPLYYLAVMRLARSARRPIAFIGQSIGPLRRRWVGSLVRRAVSPVEAMAVRDVASRQALIELGLSRLPEVTADLAFLLSPPTDGEIASARGKVGLSDVTDPVAAIALRRRPGVEQDQSMAEVGAAIGSACDRLGLRPLLIPMQPAQDTQVARAVGASLPAGRAIIAPPLRAREVLALTASCQMVIAMRLHALIFAALSRVPLVAISYDPKVDGLMEQLGLKPAAELARFDAARLKQAIEESWHRRADVSEAVGARLPRLRSLALRNVELALSLVPTA